MGLHRALEILMLGEIITNAEYRHPIDLTANAGQETERRSSWATLPVMSLPTGECFLKPMMRTDICND